MIISRLEIQNFLSIRKVVVNLEKRGLVSVQGINRDDDNFESNGSGKSSFPDSLCWCFFGRTVMGLTGDDVVHNKPQKNCYVYTDLIDDDGSKYRVARYRLHSTNKNEIIIYKDGKPVKLKDDKDANAMIVDLLHMDYSTFTSTILYSAESFRFTVSTDKEMKSAFDTMLDFDILNKCLAISKSKRDKVAAVISDLETKKSLKANSLVDAKDKLEELKTEFKGYKSNINEKISNLKETLKGVDEEIKGLEKSLKSDYDSSKYKELLNKVEKKIENLKSIESKLNELTSDINIGKRVLAQYDKDLARLMKRLTELKSKLGDKTSLVGSNCPVCGALVTKASLSQVVKEISSELSSLNAEHADLISLSKLETEKQEELITQKNSLSDSLDELQEWKDNREKLLDNIDDLSKDESKTKLRLAGLTSKRDSLKEQISGLIEDRDKKNVFEPLIHSAESKVKDIEEQIEAFDREIGKEKDILKQNEFWVAAYSNQGIKSHLLDAITPFLNQRVNYYLQKFTSDSIEVKFSTQTKLKDGQYRDKFSVDVFNKYGGKKFKSNSGGERKRIDIAVNMALQDLVASRSNKRLNIVFFDEAFDALDEIGCERVIEMLQELSGSRSSIFVTTHNSTLKQFFDNSITFIKEDGYTRLEDFEVS